MRIQNADRMQSRPEPIGWGIGSWQRGLILPLAVIVFCAILGCHEGNETETPSNANSGQGGATTSSSGIEQAEPLSAFSPDLVPGHRRRNFARMYADEYRRSEPNQDGWESEVFQEAASRQLKILADQITRSGELDAETLGRIVAGNFHATDLRPRMTEIYRDDVLIVSRAAGAPSDGMDSDATGGETDSSNEGPAALATAISPLIAALGDGRNSHAKLKVVGVMMDGEDVQTRVLYQASAEVGGHMVQQNARWSCHWSHAGSARPLLTAIVLESLEEITTRQEGGPLFSDCTEAVFGDAEAYRDQLVYGVDYWRARQERQLAPYISGLKGLVLGDVNNDGLDDIYICQGAGLPNRLFIQQVDGTLQDFTSTAGVDWMDSSNCALMVDLDNDGDQDLLVGTSVAVLVHRNDGTGNFEMAATLKVNTLVTGLTAADYDGDGKLDIYVLGRTGQDDDGSTVLGLPYPYQDANNGGQNLLYRSLGDWTFEDVTDQVGLEENNRRFSWAASWEDYDNDGDLDLYVANDFGRNNLYQYDSDAKNFADVAAEAGVEDIASGMSVSWGDHNGDGRMDLYVSNMYSGAGNRITYQRSFRPGADSATLTNIRRMARGNSLFENIGDGKFRDVSVEAGVTMGRWAWGSTFVDVNNDGREDLVVANGFVTQSKADDL